MLEQYRVSAHTLFSRILNAAKSFAFAALSRMKLHGINRRRITRGLNAFINDKSVCGISTTTRKTPLVVSLTTFPGRIGDVCLTLFSLMRQTTPPDAIVLWLAREQFPLGDEELPPPISRLTDKGLSVKWCENIGSFKKYIPALREFSDCTIVTADDDLFYPPDWLEKLVHSASRLPDAIHAHFVRRINPRTPYSTWELSAGGEVLPLARALPMTGAGVLIPPGFPFGEDIGCVGKFMALCPTQDDMWLWAMSLQSGRSVCVPSGRMSFLTYTDPWSQVSAKSGSLWQQNKHLNDGVFTALCSEYAQNQRQPAAQFH